MIASKVTITKETRAKLDNPILTKEKKNKLRQEMIKDFIRNAESGLATKQELVAAAGYNPDGTTQEYAQGLGMVNRMVRHNVISHNPTVERKKTWVVNEDVHTAPTIKPALPEMAAEIVAEAEAASKPVEDVVEEPVVVEPVTEIPQAPQGAIVELKEFPTLTSMKLVDMAKEFAWRNNSDSLRDFIDFIENAIK